MVVPVFSLGRTQEVLYVLKTAARRRKNQYRHSNLSRWQTCNSLHEDVFEECLNIKPSMVDFLPENLHFVDGDKKAKRRDIKADASQKIILCSSGMGTFGSAPSYIQHYIQIKNCMIHFSGLLY